MGTRHLIIPDSHAHPGYSNDRFTWLGKLIVDLKPDVVIDIGDMADFPSLCSHASKKEVENGRYQADVNAYLDANERIIHELRKSKKKLPRRVRVRGNHDVRPERYVDDFPLLAGKVSMADLAPGDEGWEVSPFLEPARVDGIAYVHYVISGVMRRPIGGVNVAYKQAKAAMESIITGHGHMLDFAVVGGNTGKKFMSANVGCYVDYEADYAGPANHLWDRGIFIADNVEDGIFEPRWISLDRVRKTYA